MPNNRLETDAAKPRRSTGALVNPTWRYFVEH